MDWASDICFVVVVVFFLFCSRNKIRQAGPSLGSKTRQVSWEVFLELCYWYFQVTKLQICQIWFCQSTTCCAKNDQIPMLSGQLWLWSYAHDCVNHLEAGPQSSTWLTMMHFWLATTQVKLLGKILPSCQDPPRSYKIRQDLAKTFNLGYNYGIWDCQNAK